MKVGKKECNGPGKKHNSNNMKTLALTLLIIITSFSLGYSQTNELSSFEGDWKGKGLLMGRDANFTMKWEQVLQNKYYKLVFENQFTDKSFTMNAHGYYRFSNDSTFSGYWLDSRGVSFPLKGSFSKNTLTVFWGSKELEEGKSVYELVSPDSMNVTDFVIRNGDYQQFAEASYTRE